jgi:hypothetical protein
MFVRFFLMTPNGLQLCWRAAQLHTKDNQLHHCQVTKFLFKEPPNAACNIGAVTCWAFLLRLG